MSDTEISIRFPKFYMDFSSLTGQDSRMNCKAKKLSGAQNRKRKAKVVEEAKKSSKVLAAFLSVSGKAEEIPEPSTSTGNTFYPADEDGADSTIEEKPCDKNESDSDTALPLADDSAVANPILVFNDIGFLKFSPSEKPDLDEATKMKMVKMGADAFRNEDATLPKTLCSSGAKWIARGMTKSWFHKALPNGQEVPRTWLLYSPHKEAAYCFCCLLFPKSPSNVRSAFESPEGFSNWKKIEKLKSHEENQNHRKSFLEWKEMERIHRTEGGVDKFLENQIQDEKQRWREILKRIIDVIKLLSSQNLALRGHVEHLDSKNPGNFLATLKFLSSYDAVMAHHLKNAKENPRSVSYLSHDIQNEFLSLLGDAVRGKIISEIKEAKYYGIMFDSTPDVSHTEQMSEVIRYVHLDFETGDVDVREAFIQFVELEKKDAAGYEEIILRTLEENGLNFLDCRAQMYDNAAVMSGRVSGVQTRLCEKNPKAVFINCDNHSLNLAGVHAASVDPSIVTFFGTVQEVYNFFSASTTRWKKMAEKIKLTVKKESDTRWSAREAAVRAISVSYSELIELLQSINDNSDESPDTRGKAGSLLKNLLCLDFVCYLDFWNEILRKINVVHKRLQSPNMNLREAASDLDSLKQTLSDARDSMCQSAIQKGLEVADTWDIETERRTRRRRRMAGEAAPDAGLSMKAEIERVMKLAIDTLCQQIQGRSSRIRELNSQFGFLLDMKYLLNAESEDLFQHCADFAAFYDSDVNGSSLLAEIIDCQMLLKNRNDTALSLPSTPEELLKATIQYGKDVFPNLQTALQILLTMSVSVASCERSFSKLKLIKSYLRSNMTQDRLSSLAILSIEKEAFDCIDFDDIIDKFAEKKARKIQF